MTTSDSRRREPSRVRLHLDFSEGELEQGDVFLLLTDGVWESLRDDGLRDMLKVHQEPQALAAALTPMCSR